MTIHKSQSTHNCVILSLLEIPTQMNNITFRFLYIALSRVQKGEDIRILLTSGADISSLDCIKYLVLPESNKYCLGYNNKRNKW